MQIPPLAIQTKNHSITLARAEATRYDFDLTINATKNADKIFESYWHYLSDNAATEIIASDIFNSPWTIFTFFGAIGGYIATGLTLLIVLRYRQLRPILLSGRVEAIPTIPTALAYIAPHGTTTSINGTNTITPPLPVKEIINIFQDYVPTEILLILTCLLIIAVIMILIRKNVMTIDTTMIYFELGNESTFQRVLLKRLRHFPGNYSLNMPTATANYLPVCSSNCFSTYLKFWPSDISRIQLIHQNLNFSINLPTGIKITNPLKARRIKHIICGQSFYSALLITNNNPRTLQLRPTYQTCLQTAHPPISPTDNTQPHTMQALLSRQYVT